MRHYYAGVQMGRHFKRAVHELFVEQASQSPNAIAIDGPGGSLSYARLDQRSAVLAGGLLAAGVKPRDIVVIALDRGANVLVAYLAILKVGGPRIARSISLIRRPGTSGRWKTAGQVR